MDQLALQPKFSALLEGTSSLFIGQDASVEKDRNLVEHLRSQALALAKEAGHPQFPAFLAYLLGTTSIDAHYPLQALRMLCLVAQALHISGEGSRPYVEEILLASYFADIGFRAAWLGQRGSHTELSAFRLRDMHFAWMTSSVEKLILFHHDPARDPSPNKIISLVANYLALVYGMGIDTTPESSTSPARAVEVLMQQSEHNPAGIKILLRALSMFPLGTWIELSNGQTALVVGNNEENPLRPTVGCYAPSKNGQWGWQEHVLKKESILHVVKEITPDSQQATFVNEPKLWIKGWQGESSLSATAFAAIFPQGQATLPSAKKPAVPPSHAPAHAPSTHSPMVPHDAGPRHDLTIPPAAPAAEHELKRLRSDWELHVQAIESSIQKLRDGLIESYRRENEYFKTLLQKAGHSDAHLEAPAPLAEARPPAAPAALPLTPPLPPAGEAWISEMRQALAEAATVVESMESHRVAEDQSLRSQLSRARERAEASLSKGSQNAWKQALAELDEIEAKLIDPLFARGASEGALKAFVEKLDREKDAPLSEERQEQWKADHVELAKRREAAQGEQTERVRRAAKLRELLRGYTTIR